MNRGYKRLCIGVVSALSFTGCNALGPALAGFLGGTHLAESSSRPKEVYVTEVNGDDKADVLIKTKYETLIYLGQDDKKGLCKKLEDIQAEETKRIRDLAESKLKD